MTELLRLLAIGLLFWLAQSDTNCPLTITLKGIQSSMLDSIMQISQSQYIVERAKVGHTIQFDSTPNSHVVQDSSANGTINIMSPTLRPTSFIAAEFPNDLTNETSLNLITFPFAANSLVIVYNLPDVANLNLSLSVLADIYKGKIQYWNDSRIQSNNVGVKLPLVQIELVARKDMAFETYIFTSALSTYDPDWPVKPFSSPNFTDDQISRNWPAKIHHYAKGETGMAGVVLSVPYAIGYISHVAANSYNIDHVALINRAGVATQANVVSVQSAVRYFYQLQGIRLRSPLINAEQADSYPIVWLSQLSINYQPNDCCVVRETIGFALSVLNNTENMKTYIAPILPEMTKAIIEGILSNITCQGRNIYKDFLQSQLINENEFIQDGIQIWQIIVIFVAGFILISLVSALILMIQRKKVERQEDGKWLVPFNRLQIWETEKENMGSATLLAEAKLKIQQKFQYLHIVREFEDNKVCLEELVIDDPHKWTRETKALMAQFRRNFRHLNVAGFFGFTNEGSKVFCVSEFCAKGSVHYVLTTTRHSLDNSIKYNMACDVAEGLMFLHHKGVHVGMLNSLSCCVDSHWTVKIKQWQHSTLFKNENLMNMLVFTPYKENLQNDITLINLLYVEPMTYNTKIFTAQSDIYSMGMLLFQIFARCLPYSYEVENGSYSYAEIMLLKFQHKSIELPNTLEPLPNTIKLWIRRCLSLDPNVDFSAIAKQLKADRPIKKGIVDVMMDTMESYMETLEKKVEERTGELTVLTSKMRELLNEVLPPQIASKLLKGEPVQPESFESISVYFSDIVGFTTLSSMSTPLEVMEFLNELWKIFDATIQRFDAYKVDTIGDAYMVCSGLPTRNGVEHVRQIGLLAFALLDVTSNFRIRHKPEQKLRIRIGLNSGPATTGIVGSKMPQYCVFGDTVNTAARMESTGCPMKIQCSDTTYELMSQYFPEFQLEQRGSIDVKGKGMMTTYWLIPPNEQKKIL